MAGRITCSRPIKDQASPRINSSSVDFRTLCLDDASRHLSQPRTCPELAPSQDARSSGTTVALDRSQGVESQKTYPCFEHETMADLLPSAITWRYYTPSAGSIWTAPNAIQHICVSTGPGGKCNGVAWQSNVDLVSSTMF